MIKCQCGNIETNGVASKDDHCLSNELTRKCISGADITTTVNCISTAVTEICKPSINGCYCESILTAE